MRERILVTLILFLSMTVHAGLLVDELKQQGFRCVQRPVGDICYQNKIKTPQFQYSQPVAILVPAGLRSPEKLLLHLHGYKGVCESAAAGPIEMSDQFDFLSQMTNAGFSNAAMIFPLSQGKCETYNRELVPRFSHLISWIQKVTQTGDLPLIISGHSGAGAVISAALSRHTHLLARTDGILLLDATYGITNRLGEWKSIARGLKQKEGRVSMVYVPGAATEIGSRRLKSFLDQEGVRSEILISGNRHCAVPTRDFARMLSN